MNLRDFPTCPLPPVMCSTSISYYLALSVFEQDLHQHVHLESNILFPRAIAMDESCV